MNSVSRRRFRLILDAAIGMGDRERADFLEDACARDPEFQAYVEQQPDFLPDLSALEFPWDEPEPEPVPFAGTSRFEIVRSLGTGGFGDVYEAIDRTSQLTVALKVLRGVDPTVLKSFKEGFRAVDRSSHPNLCQIYEMFLDPESGAWLLTMELIAGQGLLDYLVENPQHVRPAFQQIAEGLNALHRSNVMHCDIKPSNVLVTAAGGVKLLDFGFSRPMEGSTTPLNAVTPGYAAPELFEGAPYSMASDWFAVGAMLQRALPPAGSGEDDLATLARRLTDPDPAARPGAAEVFRVFQAGGLDGALGLAETFVGRDAQLQTIADLFREVVRGDGCVVHVTGVSGIGKTVFAQEAVRRLRRLQPGLIVFHGACYQGESVPFKGLDAVVDQIGTFLQDLPLKDASRILPASFPLVARLFPVLEALAPAHVPMPEAPDLQERRRRAFAAFCELVSNVASLAPLVILIDDLQWSDVDSSLLLRDLAAAVDARPVLLLLMRRSEEQDPPGFELLKDVRAKHIEIGALTQEQTRQMAEQLLGPALSAAAAPALMGSEGNPFLVRQIALQARSGGSIGGIQELVAGRLAGLPQAERRLLELLALAGAPLSPAVLQQAAGLGDEFLLAKTGLVKNAFARVAGGPAGALAPYHDRIAEAVADSVARTRERQLHESLARALEAHDDQDMEGIANHFHHAGLMPEACSRGRLAAERAASALAFDRAAGLYANVIEWSARAAPPRELASLERARAEALVNCGRDIEAARAFHRAQSGAPASDLTALRTRFASQLLRGGEIAEGMAALRALLSEHRLPFPEGRACGTARYLWERARLELRRRQVASDVRSGERNRLDVCWAALVGTSQVFPLLTEMYCFVYLRLAHDHGDRRILAVAQSSFASRLAYVDDGELRAARELMNNATSMAASEGVYARAFVEAMWAVVEMLGGHWRVSQQHSERSRALFLDGCLGVSWELASVTTYVFTGRTLTGDWITNARLMPALLQQARDHGDRYSEVTLQLTTGYYGKFLIEDDPDGAEANVNRCLALWPVGDFDVQQLYAFQALVDLDLYRGRPDSAWRRVERTWPALSRSGLLRLTLLETFSRAMRARAAIALAATGHPSARERRRLLKIAAGEAKRLRRCKARYATGLALLIEAGAATVCGDRNAARILLLEAESDLEKSELIPWLASARIGLAGLLEGEAAAAAKLDQGMAWMKSQQVRKPDCLARMFFPSA